MGEPLVECWSVLARNPDKRLLDEASGQRMARIKARRRRNFPNKRVRNTTTGKASGGRTWSRKEGASDAHRMDTATACTERIANPPAINGKRGNKAMLDMIAMSHKDVAIKLKGNTTHRTSSAVCIHFVAVTSPKQTAAVNTTNEAGNLSK